MPNKLEKTPIFHFLNHCCDQIIMSLFKTRQISSICKSNKNHNTQKVPDFTGTVHKGRVYMRGKPRAGPVFIKKLK